MLRGHSFIFFEVST